MDDYTLSSVAIKDGQLFLHTSSALWAIRTPARGWQIARPSAAASGDCPAFIEEIRLLKSH